MDQLFSKGALREASSAFHHMSIDREIALVKELAEDLRKGNMKDETRYEQNFNELFFHQLLGYKPKINLHPKASTPIGSKIADVGLGFFDEGLYSYEGVKVVVELKGSGTLLDKKQASYGGQSPVDQGFGYKTSFKDCPWLIVSNFATIRLYRDNKQDYQERTIEQLAQSDNDYFHLKTLLGLLKSNRLISSSGTSYTQTILSEVRVKQELITKQFYKDYKALRLELINDIRHHNAAIDVETVVEKAQKIIDRIVFIHFCEDKGLLPEGKLAEVINYGEKALSPTFQTLTNFFEAVNSGSERLEIPNGYNGGLFHTDAVVDSLKISNDICRKFVNLGRYDFDDELSVNILGHIFEQSISDIEQLKGELLGEQIVMDQLVEKKESKRKKDGIFYTPAYIVDYIVQNSLMVYLEEKEYECLKKYKNDEKKAYEAYKHILENVKVLDPACGSGAFLVKVFDYLYAENKRIGDILQQSGAIFSDDSIYKSILRNNIYGVDLNPESVEITKLSLWLKSAQKGKKLNNLDDNIKCGNSLIDDPAVAGDRAFDRKTEFSDIMGAGGFDVIVGNPPYVFTRGNMNILEKKYYNKNYKIVNFKLNTYILFIEKSYFLLKDNAYLGYIIPNNRLTLDTNHDLRKFIITKTGNNIIINMESNVFSDASVDSNILIFSKNYTSKLDIGEFDNNNIILTNNIDKSYIDKNNYLISLSKLKQIHLLPILNKIEKNNKLVELCEIKVGIQAYTVGEGIPKQTLEMKKERIYHSYQKKDKSRLKYLEGADVSRYYNTRSGLYVKYGKNLTRMRKEEFFHRKRILVRQIPNTPPYCLHATYFDDTYVNDINSMMIFSKNDYIDLKFILLLLNSRCLSFRFDKYFDKFSRKIFPQFKLGELGQFPIKNIPLSAQQPFIAKADLMLLLNKELHNKTDSFLRYISSKFGLEKLSTKLQKFYDYDFATFLKELKFKKLSMSEEAELMEFFENKKSEIVSLKNKIDATDREIDEMVYALYGLNEEEKAIVEGRD